MMITQAPIPRARHGVRKNVANLSVKRLLLLSVSVSSQVRWEDQRTADVVAGAGAGAAAVGIGVPVHIARPRGLAPPNGPRKSNKQSKLHLRQELSKLSGHVRNRGPGREKRESGC